MFENDAGDLPANYGYGGDPSTFAPNSYGASGPTSPAGINLQAGVGQYGAPFMDSASESTPQRVHPPHRVDMQYSAPFMDSASEYTPSLVHANGPHRVDMQYGAASAVDTAIDRAKQAPTVYSGSSAKDVNALRTALGLSNGGWDTALTDKLHAAQAAAGLPVADATTTELWAFLYGGSQALEAYRSRKGVLDFFKSAGAGLLTNAQRFVESRSSSAPVAGAPASTAPEPTSWTTYALYGVGGIAVLGLGYVGVKALTKKAPATTSNPKHKGKKRGSKKTSMLTQYNPFDTENVMSARNALIVAGVGLVGYGLYSYTKAPAEAATTTEPAPQKDSVTKTLLTFAAIGVVGFIAYKALGSSSESIEASADARERDIERFLLQGPRG